MATTVACLDEACGKQFRKGPLSRARYCATCQIRRHRGTPKKWKWTPEHDQLFRTRYDSRPGCALKIARQLGYPEWVVKRRAAELGVSRPRLRKNWTRAEETFLAEHAGDRTAGWIARQLKRTLASVSKRMRKLGYLRTIREGYTAKSLSECFGLGIDAVLRWIDLGWLKARRRELYDGSDGEGRHWRIEEGDVRRFVRENPTVFDLRKVDQVWFLDLVFNSRAHGNGKAA